MSQMMPVQDLRTLRLLEEIEGNERPTQRYLAEELNVSLGLVNSFLKRLAHKGYVKITTVPKNRARYILTPSGVRAKTKLTCQYVQQSYHFYKYARKMVERVFSDLEKQGVHSIALCGVSHYAEIAYILCLETAIRVVAIADVQRVGEQFVGYKVCKLSQIPSLACEAVLVTMLEPEKISHQMLLAAGLPDEKLVFLNG